MNIINLALLSSLLFNTTIFSETHSSTSSFYLSEESKEGEAKDVALELEAPHHKLIGTKEAWEYSRGEGVVVAVTDSGIAYNHPDLKDNIWRNDGETGLSADGTDLCKNGIDDDGNGKVDDCIGWNFASKNNDPIPQIRKEYHGSHVAGIVVSVENDEGSVGVAPDSKVMIVKVLPSLWSSQKIYDSYVYAVDNGAKIINTSLEIDAFVGNEILNKALKYAEDKGAIVVNAAGNNTRGNAPKMELSNLLFVANTGVGDSWGCKEDVKTPNSNWGYGIDISAPGCRINSTVTNAKHKKLSGTSMSAPVVAGALALIWSKNPEWTREQVISRMLSTADDISKINEAKFEAQLGAGRLNLERALSDKSQDPLSVWGLTKEIKTISDSFTIRFNGLADWNTLNDDTIELFLLSEDADPESTDYERLLEEQVSKLPLHISNKYKLSYGSSTVSMTNENGKIKPGKYLLKVSASLKDPFSNPLDGNADGKSGEEDNYYKVINLKEIDHFSPLLHSMEVVGEKIATPTSPEIKFVLDISDDFSGFDRVSIEIRHSLKYKIHTFVTCDESCINDKGKVEVTISASELNYDGEYYIKNIKIFDKAKPARESSYYFGLSQHYRGPKHAKESISIKAGEFKLEGFGSQQ